MAVHQATELNLPLVDESGAYISEWDDELGELWYWDRINPQAEDSFGKPYTDPETGEEKIKDHWFSEDYEAVFMYHIFTEEEITRKEEADRYQAWQELLNQSPLRLDNVEETQSSTDEAICDLYEQLIEAQDTIQTQDDAVCELYELIVGEE